METREEKLATWLEPSSSRVQQSLRVLKGSLSLTPDDLQGRVHLSEEKIENDQIGTNLLNTDDDDDDDTVSNNEDLRNLWRFKVISFPRLQPGRFGLSFSKQVFQQIQDSWDLHPRTIEVFLSKNGIFTIFHCSSSQKTWILMKVAKSRSTGSDCISVVCDSVRRTTYVLYHHLEDEASVFTTLRSTSERCLDPYFFVAALYRSHHQQIETYRDCVDGAVREPERQTGFGNPGVLMGFDLRRRASLDEYPVVANPKSKVQQTSSCQTDLAIIGHVARCCLNCGEWLIQAISASPVAEPIRSDEQNQELLEGRKAILLTVQQDVEYVRRRTVTLLSQVQALKERAQSQTNFTLNTIAQSDAEYTAEYTAAIAIDGKRDSIAMRRAPRE